MQKRLATPALLLRNLPDKIKGMHGRLLKIAAVKFFRGDSVALDPHAGLHVD
jgi:hypothetical protein